MAKEIKHEIVRGSVLKDLGFPDADAKFQIMIVLKERMEALGLNQTQAAKRIGIRQPDLSKILNGKFRKVSLERMARLVAALECRVSITIKPNNGKKTEIPLEAAA